MFTKFIKFAFKLFYKKTITMKKPYKIALDTPPFSVPSPPFLVKKLTVKGIIGNTQGVKSANNPPRNPNPKIFHIELLEALISCDNEFPCVLHFKRAFESELADMPYKISSAFSETSKFDTGVPPTIIKPDSSL